jgi:phosphopantetheinyl transferase
VNGLRPLVLLADAPMTHPSGVERVAEQSRHARVALARAAARSQAELGLLRKDADDAPLPTNGWHWSLAHARSASAAVVARTPVGIDLEAVRPRGQEFIARAADRAELELLGGFSWEAFFRLWTAKEAVLKRARCGLLELSRCRLLAAPSAELLVLRHRGEERAVSVSLRAGHAAAVTCDPGQAVEWAWEIPSEVAR